MIQLLSELTSHPFKNSVKIWQILLILSDQNSCLHCRLLPHVRGNVGFVFTRGDLVEVRDKLLENKVRAPARNGAIAPCPVIIPAQNTGLGPEKTSFFQALSIPTKISKGTIEIIVSKVAVASLPLNYRLSEDRWQKYNLFFSGKAKSYTECAIMRWYLASHFSTNGNTDCIIILC